MGDIARGRRDRGVLADWGHLDTDGEGIIIAGDLMAGDLADPRLLNEVLVVVAEGGWEKYIERSELLSVVADGRLLVSMGVRVLRKSV